MTQFAPVAPVHILHSLKSCEAFGNYHLFLAHHTTEKEVEFLKLMQDTQHQLVIMDNSIVELGGAVDNKMIKDAVRIVQQNARESTVIPVLPDVMGNGKETLGLSADNYHYWREMQMPGNGYMLVTQGSSWEDFTSLVDYFFIKERELFKYITWVGIPRKLVELLPTHTRADAIRYIQMVAPQVKIHLLGFSLDMEDDFRCARKYGIMGIDSAVPIRYDEVLYPTTTDEQIGKRGDWFENGLLGDQNLKNLENVRRWVNPYSQNTTNFAFTIQ